MYPITEAVMALFEAEQRKVLRITGTDKNGTAINITDDNVMEDSFQIDRYSCNGEKLEVGTAIAAQMSFTLENGDGTYDGIVFEDTELFAEVGVADWTQANPTIHWVPCGYFTPDMQPRRLSTISVTALDRMTKFDVVVDAADLTFPATIAGLVSQVCTLCGVTLAQSISGLVNASVAVTELPTVQGEITYRNLIQWCAGVMGTNAWFDWNGQLRFSWYNNATGYISTMDNRYSSDLYEDDLTITGVEYTNDSGIAIVEGMDDYAIDLTGNAIAGPLIATVLPPLNTALNGFTYRPFTAAVVNAPYLWPMDIVTFTDKTGNNHTSVLTNVAFGLNGTTAMESKGMTYAINKLAQPKGFTREQAQLVNQAMEHVEQDIDDSLTQQEIFNRLTDNGAAQGMVLYNGQLYVNASYISGGTIDGGTVNAKLLNIIDANGNVIASFKNVITIGKTTDAHAELDSNSFKIYSENGNMLCFIGDERDANGHANLRDIFEGTGLTRQFYLSRHAYSVSSVKINGIATSAYTLIDDNLRIEFNTAPEAGATIEVIYTTDQPVMRYDIGKRSDMSYVGPYSAVLGNGNTASGMDSVAQGSSNVASGNASHAEGSLCEATEYCSHAEGNGTKASGQSSHSEGYGTIAASYAQHVAGQFNVKDDNYTYAEIIGNGNSDSTRSNARTLDWNGNEWIAGALSVGNPGQTRANLGITPANIGAKPTQTAVADPTASGTAVAFIDSITQNANGVITPTKKTVRSASQSESGLMSATDKAKLDGIAAGAQVNSLTGVKGNAESSYRTGNVNLTPANIAFIGTNPTGGTSNDTRAWWVSKGTCYAFFNATNQVNGQPNQYGFLISIVNGSEVHQEWWTQPNGAHYYRGGNGNTSAMPNWTENVTGVKGNAESSYRTGNVNITPANISALYTAHLNGVNLDNIVYNFLGTVWNFTGTGVSAFASQCGTLICTDVDSFGTSGSCVRQVFMNFFGNDIWTRTRNGTTWSAWKCLAQNNANVGASISLTSTDTTAALLYNKLKDLELNYPASIRVVNGPMQSLTGKSIPGGYGTVVKTGVESGTLVLSFDICYVAGNYRHAFTTRVSQNTITPGAVYRYTGTAVS